MKCIMRMFTINRMHYKKLDLNLLVAFCALMVHQNVTRAARDLGITQPALSHALNRLREHYKDPLFLLLKGTMQPTARAIEIYEPITKALEQIDGTFHSTFTPTSIRRTFRIGLVEYVSVFLLPALMLQLRQDAPGAQLIVDYMSAETIVRLLGTPDLDLAIGHLPDTDARFRRETITLDRFVVIAQKQHPAIDGDLTLAKYAELEQVHIPFYTMSIDAALQRHGLSRTFAMVAHNIWSVPFLVSQSNLIATIPERIAFIFRQFCQLDVFELPFKIDLYEIDLLWHQRADADPAHRWLRNIIHMTANDIYRDLGAPVIGAVPAHGTAAGVGQGTA